MSASGWQIAVANGEWASWHVSAQKPFPLFTAVTDRFAGSRFCASNEALATRKEKRVMREMQRSSKAEPLKASSIDVRAGLLFELAAWHVAGAARSLTLQRCQLTAKTVR